MKRSGNDSSKKQVLVLYSTGSGSTRLIAETIAQALGETAEISLTEVDENRQFWPDPSRFDAVIAGSAIRYDRWLKPMSDYVKTFEKELSRKPVSFFFSCLSLAGGEAGQMSARKYEAWIRNLAPVVRPLDIRGFAGTLNYGAMPVWARLPFRTAMLFTGLKEGDYRNFSEIRDWAKEQMGVIHRTWQEDVQTARQSLTSLAQV
ncbi:MAG: hypothetical protein CMN77_06660 [Spirochaetaceae bacterium]|nr:hypothetical protein [Spirochaetaceae bacterium]|tara:strand:+ start:5419 stop:6030 length:612 start_codon:yes stop_codon:yes gene_type:complete